MSALWFKGTLNKWMEKYIHVMSQWMILTVVGFVKSVPLSVALVWWQIWCSAHY